MRILIVEKDAELARNLGNLLEKQNLTVDIVHNGKDALDYFRFVMYDGIVLDTAVPQVNGFQILERIRKEKVWVPILMLMAAGMDERVLGLEKGADDCLSRPFAAREFTARVKALVRRNAGYREQILKFGNVCLDCNRYELSSGEKTVRLNNKEYQMMELFSCNPHLVFSPEHIMDKVWGKDSETGMYVVWTYVGFLRKKLRLIEADVEIKTVRGAGYCLEEVRSQSRR